MGGAIARSLVRAGRNDITVFDQQPSARDVLRDQCPELNVVDEPQPCESAVIAVKPKDVDAAVVQAVDAGARRVLSIAAGVTLAQLHHSAGSHVSVIRAMPNIGASVGESATAMCWHSATRTQDVDWARDLLSGFGSVVAVNEEQIDAVTGLSGSGPAFVFLMVESMIDAGVAAGLSEDVARTLVFGTFRGASAMLSERTDVGQLRRDVTTPGGTTAAGLAALERHAFRSAVAQAVAASAQRSSELGAPPGR